MMSGHQVSVASQNIIFVVLRRPVCESTTVECGANRACNIISSGYITKLVAETNAMVTTAVALL